MVVNFRRFVIINVLVIMHKDIIKSLEGKSEYFSKKELFKSFILI